MPVQFLTARQRADYGRFIAEPTAVDLARYFYLDDADHQRLAGKRGEHNRLGFAVQLTSVRYLERFLDNVTHAPPSVLNTLSRQLNMADAACLSGYRDQRQRLRHIEEICQQYGYREISTPFVGFRLVRWLYAQCWTGTDRPIVLFERATTWLLSNKVLLPGASTLERFIAKLRQRVEKRLWNLLARGVTQDGQRKLETLLGVPEGHRRSLFDQLRAGPTRISGPSLVRALARLDTVRSQGVVFPQAGAIPDSRLAALARFAARAKTSAILRLPKPRRLATLAAFMLTLEASSQDDALDVLDGLLRELFGDAEKADRKARLRSLRDLDASATTLAEVCALLLDTSLQDHEVRTAIFARFPRERLERTLKEANNLVRPPDHVFYRELQGRYRRVRRFMPMLLQHVSFAAAPAGESTVAALAYLRQHYHRRQFDHNVPLEVISKAWRGYVIPDPETQVIDPCAYTFCVLDRLRIALKRRDVFVTPSWRYNDPRSGLLSGSEWATARPMICRTLGLGADPRPILEELAYELDQTYRAVLARLPHNPAVRFEGAAGKKELILSNLDKIEEPDSLMALRTAVAERVCHGSICRKFC
jgi:hypothetical protein